MEKNLRVSILYILTYIYIYVSIYNTNNSIYIYVYIYICLYIYMHIYKIMKTMCPHGYHHHRFVATHALGHMMYGWK